LIIFDDWDIQYIHGECTGSEDDELIFGHCNSKRIDEIQEIIAEYDSRSKFVSK